MGIKDLLKVLGYARTPVQTKEELMRELGGRVVGIDGHSWIHMRLSTVGDKIYCGDAEGYESIVRYFLDMISLLLECKIMPLVVFDGMKLPAKKETNEHRKREREKVMAKIESLIETDPDVALKRMKSHAAVTEPMIRMVIQNLRAYGIPYLVAPYEADAQLAYLAKKGIIESVVTEDSDLIVLGVKQILFKLKRNPVQADLFCADKLTGLHANPDFLRKACILSGCDYLKNISGIGQKTAFKTVTDIMSRPNYSPSNFISSLKSHLFAHRRKRTGTDYNRYCEQFIASEFCFKHQLVYCPNRCRFVPLTPYPLDDSDCITIDDSSSSSPESGAGTQSLVLISSPSSHSPGLLKSLGRSLGQIGKRQSSDYQSRDENSLKKMIDCWGTRLSSPEMEQKHSLGKISSHTLTHYGDDCDQDEAEMSLTKENVRAMGRALLQQEKQQNQWLMRVPIIIPSDLNPEYAWDSGSKANLIMQGKEKSGICSSSPLPSVRTGSGKEDRNEMPAKNLLQGHDCRSNNNNNSASPTPAATTTSSESLFCHDSGLERPAPAAESSQSVVTDGETLLPLIPNSASEAGAAVQVIGNTTPTRSEKRAMSFPDKGDVIRGGQQQQMQRQTQLLNPNLASERSGSNKRKESPSLRHEMTEQEKRRRHPKAIISVSSQSSSYFSPPNGVRRLPGAGQIRCPGSAPLDTSHRLPIVKPRPTSHSFTKTEEWVNSQLSGRCWSQPLVASTRSMDSEVRQHAHRPPLNEQTNTRSIPAHSFVKMQFQTSDILKSLVLPQTPAAAPFTHRLTIPRQRIGHNEAGIGDKDEVDVGDRRRTGRSSGKTPSPPRLGRTLQPHHPHPRSGNLSITTVTAASAASAHQQQLLLRLHRPSSRVTTTTQISGDSGYGSSSAS